MLDLLIGILIWLLIAAVVLGLLGYGLRFLPIAPVMRNLIVAAAVLIALLLFVQHFGRLLV